MRRVGCYAASTRLKAKEDPSTVLDALSALVRDWLASKGTLVSDGTTWSLRLSGDRNGTVSIDEISTLEGRLVEFILTEPTNSGRFLTRIVLGGRGTDFSVFVELRAGGEPLLVRPVPVDARCPDVYRQILDAREWFTGAAIVRTQPIPFLGTRGAEMLAKVVQHPDRNLPIVAVSTVDGYPLVRDLADGLARDLAGLAIVCVLNESASWQLTALLGKEWSCYNKAVRVYWPFTGGAHNAFLHPKWTPTRLMESADSAEDAAKKLRNQLRQQLVGLSTYTISEPSLLVELRREAQEQQLEAIRRRAQEEGDWRALADAYASENEVLKKGLEDIRVENERLEAQVAGLTEALRYVPGTDAVSYIAPTEEPEIETVRDAVEAARARFSDELLFGEDVEEGIQSLAKDAGPPDKLFEYLRTLAEMVHERNGAGLGKDMLIWLTERGALASSESETVLRSPAQLKARTWRDGTGGRRKFVKHLKPKDGTSPDQCVRIYFDYDEGLGKTVVGWVGRHPE